MARTVTLIPGDGIGPEVVAAARDVVEASGAEVQWEVIQAGAAVAERDGDAIPPRLIESIRRHGVALKGPVATPIGGGFASVNVALRRQLELYACLRPARSLPGVPSRYEDVDLIIVRENTEGLYSGLEHEVTAGVVESLKIVTEAASRRISRFAFEYAQEHGRRKITAVHKANIMKMSDGLFLKIAREVAAAYPEIEYEECIIDACCMHLVQNPAQFDMLLMGNLYGDIISDLVAGLVGGLGVTASANLGADCAVFEACHGSAPDIAGQGIANPTAIIFAAAWMLEYIGQPEAGGRIRAAIDSVLKVGECVTGDLGGQATTREMTQAVIAALPGA